jgi:hypothetical protein
VRPNVFDPFIPTTQKLDDRSLDRIDWWVKCLKDEGIYVWMDLHVGRQFAKGDNVEGFAELARRQGSGKGFSYVNPSIEKLMLKFAEQYLFRTNPTPVNVTPTSPRFRGSSPTRTTSRSTTERRSPTKPTPCTASFQRWRGGSRPPQFAGASERRLVAAGHREDRAQ